MFGRSAAQARGPLGAAAQPTEIIAMATTLIANADWAIAWQAHAGRHVYMRGVASGGDGNHSASLPSVGIYLDEQPITTIGGALDIHVYDIARVEALAGPQGTLYGASSEAGTIRIITNKPDLSGFSASYDARVSQTENGSVGGTVEGYVNVPISDNMAIRLVAWDEQFDWTHKFLHTDNWVAIAARHLTDELLLAADPIEFAIGTNFVFETGFTNLQFIGLGAVAPTALLVEGAAKALIGSKLDDAAVEKAAEACRAACRPIDL